MILLLVCYTAAIGVVCSAAAFWAERAALLARRPVRAIWVVALGAACAFPAAAVWRARASSGGGISLDMLVDLLAAMHGADAGTQDARRAFLGGHLMARATERWAGLDRSLAVWWATLAAVALVRLAARAWRTQRAMDAQRRDPRTRVYAVDRARVLSTPTFGPGVLGGWRTTVVLPSWARECLTRTERWLVFAHEAEHVRAGDSRLLVAAAVLVALAPWSPAGWWMLARLRAAVELDCDRRVLARAQRRAAAPVAAYGTLLLDVAARHAAAAPLRRRLAPALAESSRTTLERRIRQMTALHATPRRARLALLACSTLACIVVACELPRPTGPRTVILVPLAIYDRDPAAVPHPEAPERARLLTSARLAAVAPRARVDRRVLVRDDRPVDTIPVSRPDSARAAGSRPRAATPDSVRKGRNRMLAVVRDSGRVLEITTLDSAGRPTGPTVRRPGPATWTGAASADSMLVVIDGRKVAGGPQALHWLNGVSSDTIAQVVVFKGDAAVRVSGDRGRTTVVEITTKKAQAGAP